MLSYFAPAYVKEALLVLKNARKLLHYKRDILPAADVQEFEATISRLEQAVKDRDQAAVEQAEQTIDQQWSKHLPPASEAAWRENCEVFLVAIIIAIGVRTFFLQPFTIPTGSMQPTLNGIIGHPSSQPAPNLLVQAFDFVMRGRNYINVVAKSDETVELMTEHKPLYFFTVTQIRTDRNSYSVWAPSDTLRHDFDVADGREPGRAASHFQAGEIIARGAVDAGDHVFVDKVSYNFHAPQRGKVFVFSTRGIPRIEGGLRRQGVEGSQFYIKRLAGLPGDTLRIDSPKLYINGEVPPDFGFQRVMAAINGYRGYSNPMPYNPMFDMGAFYLTDPQASFHVPPNKYFAMGDNSYNSSDSRYWGTVPEENLMGRGLFVYWPFLPHWGFVR